MRPKPWSAYNYDGENGIYKHKQWFSFLSSDDKRAVSESSKSVAVTFISNDFYPPYDILSADIIFNYRDYKFSMGGHIPETLDFKTILRHEIGHFLGLNHIPDSTSIMYPGIKEGDVRNIARVDRRALANLYGQPFLRASTEPLPSRNTRVIQTMMALDITGECRHYTNGVFTTSHKVDLTENQ